MKTQIKVKVCGMKYSQNITKIANLNPDYMGFIFYQKSKRVVNEETFTATTTNVKKIGVFVNQSTEFMTEMIDKYSLNGVQLHGDETPEICAFMKSRTLVIKAFQINEDFSFNDLNLYQSKVNYFLFDTKTNNRERGGTGEKFNWNLLGNYTLNIPFFLSGGISLEDAEEVRKFSHPQFFGVDINSRFEEDPGLKNAKKITTFIQQIKQ